MRQQNEFSCVLLFGLDVSKYIKNICVNEKEKRLIYSSLLLEEQYNNVNLEIDIITSGFVIKKMTWHQ